MCLRKAWHVATTGERVARTDHQSLNAKPNAWSSWPFESVDWGMWDWHTPPSICSQDAEGYDLTWLVARD